VLNNEFVTLGLHDPLSIQAHTPANEQSHVGRLHVSNLVAASSRAALSYSVLAASSTLQMLPTFCKIKIRSQMMADSSALPLKE
jgi:hypothetical protein